jgi:RNA-directed DNA polymerase
MGREFHVRFREGLGVRFPRATRLVMGFTCAEDARRVLDILPKRFGKYGLTIHPDKTRLVLFRSPAAPPRDDDGTGTLPGTFDLLGFTHYWGRSRKGQWVVKRRTAVSRLRQAIRRIAEWCRCNRHRPVAEQHRTLWQKVRGHLAYYGITGNGGALHRFRDAVVRLWRKWLSRRSRGDPLSWDRFNQLLARYPLPAAVVVHSVYR